MKQDQLLNCIINNQTPNEEGVIAAGRLDPQQAVQVYHTAYQARLSEALGETYEPLWRVLGDDDFFKCCKEYIKTQASQSWNLSDYGESWPEFLKTSNYLQSFPFLSELAHMSWQLKELFHQVEEPGISRERAGQVLHAGDFKIEFVSHYQILSYSYAIYDIWLALKNDMEPERIDQAQNLILYKKDHQVNIKLMADKELKLFNYFLQNQSLLEIAEQNEGQFSQEDMSAFFNFIFSADLVKVMS